jgi:hypothetical protein
MRETAAALAQRFVGEMSPSVALLDRVGQRAGIYRGLFDAWARERGLTVAEAKAVRVAVLRCVCVSRRPARGRR